MPTSGGKTKYTIVLDDILELEFPPVARCRLLSNGLEAYCRLNLMLDEMVGDKGCIGCGNCVDSCPVLRREPERLEKSGQRTSMLLETLIAEDCEKCYACLLSCPQVDIELKDYVVDNKIIEVVPQDPLLRKLDENTYLVPIIAFILGIIIGMFINW